MENASKALLIAGGVLITIIIISLGVTLYVLFSDQAKQYSQIMDTTEIQKFNSYFDVYIGREDIKAQEIVSIVNLAKEFNNSIRIKVIKNGISQNMSDSESFLKNNIDTIFKCKHISGSNKKNPIYDSSGRIKQLCFTN